MGKHIYHDSDRIMMCLGEAENLRITDDDMLLQFIRYRTGYDIDKGGLAYHKTKYNKEYKPDYSTWIQHFASNQILDTAKTHLDILHDIRNDLYFIYSKKVKTYKDKLSENIEPEPMELTELLDVKGHIEGTLDHIEKRDLALLYILPVKITMDKRGPKLDKADPDTRTAVLVSELEAEHIEESEKSLQNYTEIHGEENLTA